MKRPSKKSDKWQDHYTRLAKKERYPARSVYKLQEIQQKHRILKSGDHVLDLGCAPGSWLMAAARIVGGNGLVVGIDLNKVTVQLPFHVRTVEGDIFHWDSELKQVAGDRFHVVVSDMAPATTGNRLVDTARSHNLCEAALAIADDVLMPGGHFVCKIFQGEEFAAFSNAVKDRFDRRAVFKPKSTRKASKEIYLIGKSKK